MSSNESHLEDEFPPWTQVPLSVSPLAEEGLANLLFELGAGGLIAQEATPSYLRLAAFSPSEIHIPLTLGISTCSLTSLKDLGIDPGPSEVQTVPWKETGEAERWKDLFKPLGVGKRLVIKPNWEDYCPDPEEVIIGIDRGRDFGTGRHPTTAICPRFPGEVGQRRGKNLGSGHGIGHFGHCGPKIGREVRKGLGN